MQRVDLILRPFGWRCDTNISENGNDAKDTSPIWNYKSEYLSVEGTWASKRKESTSAKICLCPQRSDLLAFDCLHYWTASWPTKWTRFNGLTVINVCYCEIFAGNRGGNWALFRGNRSHEKVISSDQFCCGYDRSFQISPTINQGWFQHLDPLRPLPYILRETRERVNSACL